MAIKDVGLRVLMRRRELGLSQGELAALCQCPYQVISRLEHGKQDIYTQRLATLAQALRVLRDAGGAPVRTGSTT